MLTPRQLHPGLIALCLLLWIPAVLAQSTKKGDTAIRGVVLDANGKSVSAAAVTCQSSAGIHPRVVHTDSKGQFVLTGLKQDAYDLRASSDGAYSDWEKNVPLRKGQTKQVTLRLLNGNTAISGVLPAKKKSD
jgi:Carboxypeptidase regulatory-like domain